MTNLRDYHFFDHLISHLKITFFSFLILLISWDCNKHNPVENDEDLNSGKYLNSIYFTDSNNGYSVGDDGLILKTTNGGVNWTQLNPYGSNLVAVCFPSLNEGYFVSFFTSGAGYGGIYKTSDAANSWSRLISYMPILNNISFITPEIGFAVGQHGTLLKTINGGNDWTAPSTGRTENLLSIHFNSVKNGCVVGSNGLVMTTIDTGNNWVFHPTYIPNALIAVSFPTNNIGFATGTLGIILKTEDEGVTWNFQYSGTTQNLKSLYFVNSKTGYVIGDSGIILKTNDGGIKWTPPNSSLPVSGAQIEFRTVFFTDSLTGYVVGGVKDYSLVVYPLILKTTDGGRKWMRQF